MISFERYHDLFAVPQLRATLIASIVGRLPIGIAGLAILLFVQRQYGSFALAGSASALYVLGLAAVAPFLGRLMDRFGPRPVLLGCGLLYPAAMIALAALVLASAPAQPVNIMAFLAGATLPPISACTRALYPRLIGEPALLQTAYSVDSAVVEIVFVLGPALVAACVAFGHPEAAVVLAAVAALCGGSIFVATPSIKSWTRAASRRQRGWLGVLRSRRLLVVYTATVLYSIGFGLYEVAVTAHASSKGVPAAAGIALALASVGSGLGAVVYGSRHWRAPLKTQFLIALTLMCAGFLLLVPVDQLALYALVSVVTGVPMATVIAAQSLLIARYASREELAESFTWATTCLLAGVSSGIAIGGALAEVMPAYWLLIAAGGVTALAAVEVMFAIER
jgi:MFS family permease